MWCLRDGIRELYLSGSSCAWDYWTCSPMKCHWYWVSKVDKYVQSRVE